MNTNQDAAQDLLDMAIHETVLNQAYILIDSAYRLDAGIDVEYWKEWVLDNWLERESDKRSIK